jgi:diadenosine tetraphosphate (Ap4A) HIT family hydrolase
MNETMRRFGYPDSLIRDSAHWVVLLRPDQVTLGSLVLACKEPATAFSDISPGAFGELGGMVQGIEQALRACFAYDKINYLMLMMVDREVHFHVIPRYAAPRDFAGSLVPDKGWPRQPDLGSPTKLTDDQMQALRDTLRKAWP